MSCSSIPPVGIAGPGHCEIPPAAPDPWLAAAAPMLSAHRPGPVLDLACGEGRNAFWLAGLGLAVVGVDASDVLIRRAREHAGGRGLDVVFRVARIEAGQPLPRPRGGAWGAIVVVHFLDRALFPLIQEALAPGGLLVYKTHLDHRLRPPTARPRRAAYLLESGELLTAFPRLVTLAYREWAEPGRAYAALLARRPRDHSL